LFSLMELALAEIVNEKRNTVIILEIWIKIFINI